MTEQVQLSEVRNGLVRIAVAYTGGFEYPGKGTFKITEKDLFNMRERLAEREVPIDYEHLSAVPAVPPGYTKAAGWIRKPDGIEEMDSGMRGNDNSRESGGPSRKILWAWAEFTPVMLAMIKQKEYRYFSPEIHWSDKDEEGNGIGTVLKAAAITNRPFLKDLPPIELSDADYQQLFGLAAREDCRLPAISLSERSETLVSLDPGTATQESGAYEQSPSIDPRVRGGDSPVDGHSRESGDLKENTMKTLKCRKLTEGEYQGKIGVFDDNNLIGIAEFPVAEEDEQQLSEFAALSEAIHGGKLNLIEAGRLAGEGKVSFSAVLLAREAEEKVESAIKAGKVLPKNRAHALKLALTDSGAFKALVEDARPAVDLKARGFAGSGSPSATQELTAKAGAYAREHKVPMSVALTEVTKAEPGLWERYNEETVLAVAAAEEEEK